MVPVERKMNQKNNTMLAKRTPIDAVLLADLDRYIEENYIPPESIPVGSLYLPDANTIILSKKTWRMKK
jgi:hypothetical protein